MSEWLGKSVSITCKNNLGIFQGTIFSVSASRITITRAFRNGLPLKKEFMEVTIASSDIEKLEVIPSYGGSLIPPEKGQNTSVTMQKSLTTTVNTTENLKLTTSQPKFNKSPPNMRPYKNNNKSPANGRPFNGDSSCGRNSSKPIDIGVRSSSVGNGIRNNNNGQQRKPKKYNKHETFGTPVDDPMLGEDFDFEKNLALFDKQAIWDELDGLQKPDVVRQTMNGHNGKYRHDENVIVSGPTQYRQIIVDFDNSQEYVTDEGLVIPSIPRVIRNKIQSLADAHSLTLERQNEVFARGVAEVALQLLGGSRRLTPNNRHQWPKITIICDESYNHRLSEIGICAGRHLASHGLKIHIFVSCSTQSERLSNEIELFAATGNYFSNNPNTLQSCDLVIIASLSSEMKNSSKLKNWFNSNRAPVLAIDPPVKGIEDLPVKCSVLPILPLNDLDVRALGKLYLCNLGIPDKFYQDSGIKYKSPFDKFVIPIHKQA